MPQTVEEVPMLDMRGTERMVVQWIVDPRCQNDNNWKMVSLEVARADGDMCEHITFITAHWIGIINDIW